MAKKKKDSGFFNLLNVVTESDSLTDTEETVSVDDNFFSIANIDTESKDKPGGQIFMFGEGYDLINVSENGDGAGSADTTGELVGASSDTKNTASDDVTKDDDADTAEAETMDDTDDTEEEAFDSADDTDANDTSVTDDTEDIEDTDDTDDSEDSEDSAFIEATDTEDTDAFGEEALIDEEDESDTEGLAGFTEALNVEENSEMLDNANITDGTVEDITNRFPSDDTYVISMAEMGELESKISVSDSASENDLSGAEPDRLPTFEEIKRKWKAESFETPYTFNGANGERVRYRLSIPGKKYNSKANRNRLKAMSIILTFTVALILALFIRAYVLVIATVDGPSMQPTLHHAEKLIVTKYTYIFSDIQRGDIVICRYDHPNYKDLYVKRVIAVGGDTVRITDGVVYINDQPIVEEYILEAPRADMESYFVPLGHVFVMGDNRNNSADSRKDYIGAIKNEAVIGKVQIRFFPFNKITKLEDYH